MHFCFVSRQQWCRIEGIFWTGMELVFVWIRYKNVQRIQKHIRADRDEMFSMTKSDLWGEKRRATENKQKKQKNNLARRIPQEKLWHFAANLLLTCRPRTKNAISLRFYKHSILWQFTIYCKVVVHFRYDENREGWFWPKAKAISTVFQQVLKHK